jgi:AbiV family abortive infection protein
MSVSIPVADVSKGVSISIEKAQGYFDVASSLIENGRTDQGCVFAVCGLEELGRAVMLNQRLHAANSSGQRYIEIANREFYNHIAKQQAALSILPGSLQDLAMGTFDLQSVGTSFFRKREGRMDVIQDLREKAQYVDYTDGQWQSSLPVDPSGLQAFINGVKEEISKFQKYAVSYSEG